MSPALSVLVLHDPVGPDAPPDRLDSLDQAEAVAGALARLGHRPRLTPFLPDLSAMRAEFTCLRPDAAFNLVENVAGLDRLAFAAPALLEALGIPCTGNPAGALLATAGKSAVKRRLHQAGLPTPRWLASAPLPVDAAPEAEGAYILKPEFEHGSVGIAEDAVVRAVSTAQLAGLLRAREEALGLACLAEAYLPGREFAMSVCSGPDGPEAMPPAEMLFPEHWREQTRVLTYAAKWLKESSAARDTCRAFPPIDPELAARLADTALAAWRVFGLRGYARVDFRLDALGHPQIIDVNANPCLAPDAGFAAAALRAGLGYDALVARVLQAALADAGHGQAPAAPSTAEYSAKATGAGEGPLRWRSTVAPGDVEAVRRLTQATGFFNPEEVEVAGELVQEHLARGEASGYLFLFAEDGAGLAGYACYGPVPGTADSFDLYWIAVAPQRQGRGLGGRVLERAEADMAARGARGIYAETSSRGQYLPTRRFYESHGYAACSRLAGFYAEGDDKIIYHKHAAQRRPA
jgi:D-alanine-D-alanine ligase